MEKKSIGHLYIDSEVKHEFDVFQVTEKCATHTDALKLLLQRAKNAKNR